MDLQVETWYVCVIDQPWVLGSDGAERTKVGAIWECGLMVYGPGIVSA